MTHLYWSHEWVVCMAGKRHPSCHDLVLLPVWQPGLVDENSKALSLELSVKDVSQYWLPT